MSAYSPASSVGWLDLDAAASERVAALLRSLEEPGTLDPLGLGSVRDNFSAMLAPGTSTIQTRVRYFVFLPWIFRALEAQRVAPGEFAERLLDHEARLIQCLRHLGPGQGVIGFNAGRELQRMPSEVYWGGLGAWGIRRRDLSIREYAMHAAALGRLRPDRDDDGNVTTTSRSMWSRTPDPPDDFLRAHISFDLEREEAQVLVDHIRRRHPKSLVAAMCAAPALADTATFPWDLPATAPLPGELRNVLRHARCFSELTVGPQHVYNILLARRARAEFGWDTRDLEDAQTARLATWSELVAHTYDELRAWVDDLPELWSLLAEINPVAERTRAFLSALLTAAVADPSRFGQDEIVHAMITRRELQLKGKRARVAHRSALESWNQAPFGGQLDYRWPIAKSYLRDIAHAMARAD